MAPALPLLTRATGFPRATIDAAADASAAGCPAPTSQSVGGTKNGFLVRGSRLPSNFLYAPVAIYLDLLPIKLCCSSVHQSAGRHAVSHPPAAEDGIQSTFRRRSSSPLGVYSEDEPFLTVAAGMKVAEGGEGPGGADAAGADDEAVRRSFKGYRGRGQRLMRWVPFSWEFGNPCPLLRHHLPSFLLFNMCHLIWL